MGTARPSLVAWLLLVIVWVGVSCRFDYERLADGGGLDGGGAAGLSGGAAPSGHSNVGGDPEPGTSGVAGVPDVGNEPGTLGGREGSSGGTAGEGAADAGSGGLGGAGATNGGSGQGPGGGGTGDISSSTSGGCHGSIDTPTEAPSVTSAAVFQPGEPIEVTFTGAQTAHDWIGIYSNREEPGRIASLFWFYVNGSHAACELVTSGTLVFDAMNNGKNRGTWPPRAGDYRLYLLANDGYAIRAQGAFRVER